MFNQVRRPLSVVVVAWVGLAVLSPVQAQPPGRHGHNFPHPKTKEYRSLKKREVKKEKTVYLYGNHECPISGKTVVPESYIDYRDDEHNTYARIYLCCEGCEKKAKEALPDLYYKLYRMDKTGKEVEARTVENKTCPVMKDEPVSPHVAIEYNGMIVNFHHSECIAAFLDDPEPGMGRILPEAKEYKYERPKDAHN